MDKADKANCAIILPVDAVVSWHFKAKSPTRLYGVDAVDPDGMILDIGPQSIERINGAIDDAHTVIWNGPVGAFEMEPFDAGTVAIAKHVAKRTHDGHLISVAGGGDTVSALAHAGVKDVLTYVSTAGGAFLEWMEGKPLPGVDALKK
jgi:phosphoglycerate kinase